ncbi:isocitrate dehydrogenase [Tanacetum coccineum]
MKVGTRPLSYLEEVHAYQEYEHRLTNDMVAYALKSDGVMYGHAKTMMEMRKVICFESLGLWTLVLVCPDRRTIKTKVVHGIMTYHYKVHLKGGETQQHINGESGSVNTNWDDVVVLRDEEVKS